MKMKRVSVPFELKALDDSAMIFEGWAATFDVVDRGGDMLVKGAFAKDIDRFLESGFIADQHSWERPIGKVLKIEERNEGLWVRGQLIDTSAGVDMYKLMRAGVVKGLSIGYTEVQSERVDGQEAERLVNASTALTDAEKRDIMRKGGVRKVTEVQLYDISPVSVPMNPAAVVTSVKSVQNADLPLADRDYEWDSDAAEARVRRWAEAEDAPNERYARAFFWVDDSATDQFGSYKLQYADVVEGELRAVPHAIFAVAAVLQGARGGVDIPDADIDELKAVVERWYDRMADEFDDDSIVAPWNEKAVEIGTEGGAGITELAGRVEELVDAIASNLAELQTLVQDLIGSTQQPATHPASYPEDEVSEKSLVIPDVILRVAREVY